MQLELHLASKNLLKHSLWFFKKPGMSWNNSRKHAGHTITENDWRVESGGGYKSIPLRSADPLHVNSSSLDCLKLMLI